MSSTHILPDNENNTEELAEGSRSILLSIASQLTKGMDLHKVALPTFVLEPRSMLERITDFMAHPEFILPISSIDNETERFIAVVKWFLSGWHIKPKGVKKPYNPVLGEFFRCQYKLEDGSDAYYISEQVSHHPPASAYFYTCPQHKVIITGELKPKSRFYGNSVGSLMHGTCHVILPSRHNEQYEIKMPNMYGRNVLFGTMTLELGDTSTVTCKTSDLACEIEFQNKGFFSGQPNSVIGKIKKASTQEILYELSGQWSGQLFIKKYTAPEKSSLSGFLPFGKSSSSNTNNNCKETKSLLVDVREHTKFPFSVKPEECQESKESRRLWSKLTDAIIKNDQDTATEEKTQIEDRERALRKERQDKNVQWKPRFFDYDGEDSKFKLLDKLNYSQPQEVCKTLDSLY